MKKFYLLTKTLLVATMLLAGASNAWGTSQTKIVLYSEDYSEYSVNNETVSDWTVRQNGTAVFDKAGGYAKLNSDGTSNRGFLYTSFGISDDIWTDAKWKGMTDYFIEFDFDYYHGEDASISQFVVTSASTPNLGNSAYTGNERLFSFYTASSTASESPATLYMNETSATGDKTMSITKEQACRYHVKLTVGASSVAYAVTKKSDKSSVVSGSYTLESGVSNKVTGMWVALGKKWSRMMIDNIEVYYMASPIGNFSLASTGDYYIKDGDATGKYIRTTYDFTGYTYGTSKSGTSYVPSGFDESTGTRYETTISGEKKSVPSGLTFNKSTGTNGYLQYYKNCGLQAGTAALTLSVTNATANTVSYLYYKQGDAGKTNTVAATSESEPITISGTASEVLPVKTTSYKLYTRLEVFTKDVPVEVSAAGYATYVSAYNLDFTSTSIKAYTATVNTSTGVVTLNPINKVPAGTPVVLYKDGGATENIPVAASTDEVGDNDLVAGTGGAVATGTGPYNYILNNVSGIGFYRAAGQTVAANRAYLQTTYVSSGARGMTLEFADDTLTGISEAEAATEAVAKEGKFFENGKLIIFKKGMKFYANGQVIK